MSTRSNRVGPKDTRSICRPRRLPDGVQLIYAHLPPAPVLAGQQHLRAQTSLEQAGCRRWFASERWPGGAYENWLRTENELVNQLCEALMRGSLTRPQPTPAFHSPVPLTDPARQPTG